MTAARTSAADSHSPVRHRRRNAPGRQQGLSLLEMLVSVIIAGMVITASSNMMSLAAGFRDTSGSRSALLRDAHTAMAHMVRAVKGSPALLVPALDSPATNWREDIRVQTIPPSAPEGSSTFASAALVVLLDPTEDIDHDGIPDADNDGDGQIDEDPPGDINFDKQAGVAGIDDDGDGLVDETHIGSGPFADDDDEDGTANEDEWNGLDDDGDNRIDEDIKKQATDDGQAGVAGIDDDGDGSIDEGDKNDDDEDGLVDEDWLDTVAFHLVGQSLTLRRPDPPGLVPDMLDAYVRTWVLAEQVTRLAFTRSAGADGTTLVRIELTLDDGNNPPVSLDTTVRLASSL